MNKSELRRIYSEKRNALGEGEHHQLSRLLCERFFASTELSFVKIIHCYLPLEKKSEPNTWLIIDRVRREFPHIRITLPKVIKDNLESIFFEGLHQLRKNNWGLWEPLQGSPASPEKIDMVVVPLLAFDRQGHRLGYGRGYYDRFLKTCNPSCKKVGLAFFGPEEKIDDISPQDVALDRCVTPDQVYDF